MDPRTIIKSRQIPLTRTKSPVVDDFRGSRRAIELGSSSTLSPIKVINRDFPIYNLYAGCTEIVVQKTLITTLSVTDSVNFSLI